MKRVIATAEKLTTPPPDTPVVRLTLDLSEVQVQSLRTFVGHVAGNESVLGTVTNSIFKALDDLGYRPRPSAGCLIQSVSSSTILLEHDA